jgi:anti-sigma factor RsiW
MLKCREIPELTSALLDGQLSFSQRLGVHAHLFICQRCKNYWLSLRRITSALASYQSPPSEQQLEEIIEFVHNAERG